MSIEMEAHASKTVEANGTNNHMLDFEPKFSTLKRKEASIKLVWKDIEYSVNGNGPKKKVLLKKISGEASPGEVVALMGPSGAGKTTLLNILAGRITGGHGGKILTGSILANGERVRPGAFRKHVAYVTQEDALFATSTAREALEFSARLRLPKTTSKAERTKLVDDIIESLGLKKCENTMIGSDLIRGVSGGEKKRVAIGVELVSNPTCLFLDEPTSGLDSYSALNVVGVLKAISSTGCTIICSIHQPSSEVFNAFDSLVLLGNGSVIYQGKIADVDEPFKAVGLGVPPRTNVADHVMLLIQTRPLETLPNDDENRRRYGGNLPPDASLVPDKKVGVTALKSFSSKLASFSSFGLIDSADSTVPPEARVNVFVQAWWLSIREFRSLYRDTGSLIGRFGGTAFMNVLCAVLFLNAGNQYNPKYTLNSHFGAMVQFWIGGMFGAAQPALLLFPLERIVFIREKATNTYGTVPYVFAKLLVELPVSFLTALLIMLICYWTVGFQGDFFLLTLSLWALMLASTSTAYILGSVVSTPKAAQELGPMLLVPQILFLGLFIRIDQMPIWLQWAQYLCATKYSLNLAMIVEFDPALAVNQTNAIEFEELLSFNQVNRSDSWIYALILMAIFAGFRFISLILLNEKAKSFST